MAVSEQARRIERDPELGRYLRQILFAPVGEAGQRKLLAARVTLIGCGGLGSALANMLARAGVGLLRIVDRDYIELHNLQRQVLFDEDDIAANLPKAEAARRKLQRINSNIAVEAVVADVNHHNIERLTEGADLLLDGTDNFETRFLINDLAVKTDRPWVYGACVGATGLSMPVLPKDTPCLRCVFEQSPPPEMSPTCHTIGVLGPVVGMVASHQALEAMKILTGRLDAVDRRLLRFDAWTGRIAQLEVAKARDESDCPCCKGRDFAYLQGKFALGDAVPWGPDAVQVTPAGETKIDFATLAQRIKAAAGTSPRFNAFMLKAWIDPFELTVFADGRAIIKGTNEADQARAIYAKYVEA